LHGLYSGTGVRKRTCLLKNFINFVDDEKFQLAEVNGTLLYKVGQPTWSCNNDGGGRSLELLRLLLDAFATSDGHHGNATAVHEGAEPLVLENNLLNKFFGGLNDDTVNVARILARIVTIKRDQNEHRGLAHAGLGLRNDIIAGVSLRNGLFLNFGRLLKAGSCDGFGDLRLQAKIRKSGGRATNSGVAAADHGGGGDVVLLIGHVLRELASVGHC